MSVTFWDLHSIKSSNVNDKVFSDFIKNEKTLYLGG